jgi:hypothetical protein
VLKLANNPIIDDIMAAGRRGGVVEMLRLFSSQEYRYKYEAWV